MPHVHPERTLWLVSAAHAVNHAQAVVLPLVYLRVIGEWGVDVAAIAYLTAASAFVSGTIQLAFAKLTRLVPRRGLLGAGGILFGGGFAALALMPSFASFAAVNVASRIGGAPQHPIGNALLAEQFPLRRRGFAISAHIAGGNVGTVVVGLIGAWLVAGIGWRWTVVLFGVPAILIALAIMLWVRETGTDRAAALAEGSVRDAFRAVLRDPNHRWIFLTSVLGGGGRGLGVVNLFVLLWLSQVIGMNEAEAGLMYGALIVFSVPAPLAAGWLSDRFGRKPLIIGAYLGGALGFAIFILAGSSLVGLWAGIVVMGLFTFAESPQLQALLADVAPPGVRDASFATYFTLAFGVGSLWVAVYGAIVEWLGASAGLTVVFALMAISFIAAALAVVPVREQPVRHAD